MQSSKLLTMMTCAALASACVDDPREDEIQETIDNLTKAGFPSSDIQVHDGAV